MLSWILFMTTMVELSTANNISFTIRAHYPGSRLPFEIRGVGGGLPGWGTAVPMTMSTPQTWDAKLSWSDGGGGLITFKVLMNGGWQIGRNEVATLPSVSGTVIDVFPWFQSMEGKYSVVGSLQSTVLNNTRDIIVYVPPSFWENTLKPYRRVLVMHDGQNLFNDSTSFAGVAWRIQDTLNALIVKGTMEEVLVVGVYNTPNRIGEYTYSYDPTVGAGGQGDLYLDFLEHQLLPFVKSNLAGRIAPTATFDMLGSSLGGLISCYAGWTRPQVWTRVGCMSSSFWWNSQDFNSTVLVKFPNPSQPPAHMIYIDTGDNEGSDPASQVAQTELIVSRIGGFPNWSMGINLQYYLDMGGQHSEYYWGRRFWSPMQFLYSD